MSHPPTRAYEEVIEFIAAAADPGRVAAFRPSDAVREQVGDPIRREKGPGLGPREASELDHYLLLEHLMRLAKARPRKG